MNYIGSKLSLIDFLVSIIEQKTKLSGNKNIVFADLFAGTGVVGKTFRDKGYSVISNDIQYYSYVLNKHNIENSSKIDKCIIDKLNNLKGEKGFIYNNYCMGSGSNRNYFSDLNGQKCDAIRRKIEEMYKNKEISENIYFSLLASLINSIDKYANTASVYGAFLKELKKSAEKDFTLEALPVSKGPKGRVYNKNANDLIREISGNILYLDPPYNSRQYCSNYHVLETVARNDNPKLKGKTGLRENDSKQKSSFCSKRTVYNSLKEIIEEAKFEWVFLSYNNEGLLTLDEIREIMEEYGEYSLFTKEYKRFKADRDENRNHKSSVTTEYLHCLHKNSSTSLEAELSIF